MAYLGSWKIDDLLTFYANTQVFATGVATDADAVPPYRIYEDETTTPILTGNMALLDAANTAGFYSEQITLSAANGFEKGKTYAVHIAATVSGVVGAKHDTFQIEAEVDANRLNWANVDNPTSTIGLTNTTVGIVTLVNGLADGILTAAKFAAGAFDAVWTVTVRVLTAGTNIVLAKGVGVTGFNDLSSAQVGDAVWDEAVDGAVTARESIRLANSANGAITSGGGTAAFVIRDLADSKDRVQATVDADGNRSAVTRDLT